MMSSIVWKPALIRLIHSYFGAVRALSIGSKLARKGLQQHVGMMSSSVWKLALIRLIHSNSVLASSTEVLTGAQAFLQHVVCATRFAVEIAAKRVKQCC